MCLLWSLGNTTCNTFANRHQNHHMRRIYMYNNLFICLWFFVQLENFSLISRPHHCRRRAANIDLYLVLMVIKQWGFFNVPHLLWHGASVYNGHIRGPVTLTPKCRAFSRGAVTTCFYDLGLSRLGFKHPIFHLQGKRYKPIRHRRDRIYNKEHSLCLWTFWQLHASYRD